ncbi:hypothetical protein GMORB2_2541 [Geosmithia morbida]|uniref:Uncharacterized protein n=1 Tax=Geosmithia morbida TaxID=1094350 RepID=A0A9P5D2Q8_9HYPO|nr:uncharacterized protein GMORB2_2541 [Geosmithia morbida]KAF4121055.1 hypothetical protein GMORB2_2541 [Geosmithia morbida]
MGPVALDVAFLLLNISVRLTACEVNMSKEPWRNPELSDDIKDLRANLPQV